MNQNLNKSKNPIKDVNPALSPFNCTLNDILVQKIRDPSIYIYQWISDLNSGDLSTVSKAAKMILRNLKSNVSISSLKITLLFQKNTHNKLFTNILAIVINALN